MLLENAQTDIPDKIQQMITRIIAENPAGRGLCLIGGFRFRLLDNSPRRSVDIDYHWNGDVAWKVEQLTVLFERRLIPEAKRVLGLDGNVHPGGGPGDDSLFVKTIETAFYRLDTALPRIEIPVEITSIPCIDPPHVRTRSGRVYLTVSDSDMIESKVIALLNRVYVRERDFLDIFLFTDHFAHDAERRMADKLATGHLSGVDVNRRIMHLRTNREDHIRNIETVIRTQVEPETADRLMAGGGGGMIFDQVMSVLVKKLHLTGDGGE